MANNAEIKKAAGKTQQNFIAKVGGFFKRLGVNIVSGLKNMKAELKKVTWPQKSELINYSLVVLAFLVIMGIVIFAIDAGAGALVQWMTK